MIKCVIVFLNLVTRIRKYILHITHFSCNKNQFEEQIVKLAQFLLHRLLSDTVFIHKM